MDVSSAAKNNYPGTGAFPEQQNLMPLFKILAKSSLAGEGKKPFSICRGKDWYSQSKNGKLLVWSTDEQTGCTQSKQQWFRALWSTCSSRKQFSDSQVGPRIKKGPGQMLCAMSLSLHKKSFNLLLLWMETPPHCPSCAPWCSLKQIPAQQHPKAPGKTTPQQQPWCQGESCIFIFSKTGARNKWIEKRERRRSRGLLCNWENTCKCFFSDSLADGRGTAYAICLQ